MGNDGGNGFARGGISLGAAATPLIMNNLIAKNTTQTQGGGLGISLCCDNPIITQNIFIGNSAPEGAAVYSFLLTSSGVAVFMNNSFVNNKSDSENSAVYTSSTPGQPSLFYNNIIVGLKSA